MKALGALSKGVFERCTSNRLCKSKEAKEYKFYIVKACEAGKGLTSG